MRKFFFFLDPLRSGRIKIQGCGFLKISKLEKIPRNQNQQPLNKDVLACSFLDDLLELRDEDLSGAVLEQNWFSAPSALRVYGLYLNLDRDHNGMLSRQELAKYGSGTLTPVFLSRVFQGNRID